MKTMRKLTIVLMLCLATGVMAQKKCFDHDKYKADLLEYVKKEAALNAEELSAFQPVFDEWLTKKRALFSARKQLRKSQPDNDEECRQTIVNMDKLQVETKRMEQEYHQRLLGLMPASKVLKVVRAEDQFNRNTFKRAAGKK